MNTLLHLDAEILPRSLTWERPMSDDEFEALCFANDSVHFERTKDGEILMHAPATSRTSDGNSEINRQLRNWWITHRRGKVYEGNAGFFLPDTSMLSPDASYLLPTTVKRLEEEGDHIPHVCPDFVIELRSKSDTLRATQEKMKDWIANGVKLGWLIDPPKRRVFVYSGQADPVIVSKGAIAGSGPVEGFTLDLNEVWLCYES
jgi:Uma2 family endonuclease